MPSKPNQRPARRPIGQATRGKTANNRLRRVDAWLLRYDPGLLRAHYPDTTKAWFVDLGFGAEPFTTLQSADLLQRANPQLPILGVEIDPERVHKALPFATPLIQFRLGGFNLPLEPGEGVRALRAFNVLRQYEEIQVEAAHSMLMAQLLPGGMMMEGTSDPYGRAWVANVLRRSEDSTGGNAYRYEGLLFSTNFHGGFDPAMFQPVLPKNFIHHMYPGEAIYDFIETWKACARETVSLRALGLRQWFAASAQSLAAQGYSLDLRRQFLRMGCLLWRRPA